MGSKDAGEVADVEAVLASPDERLLPVSVILSVVDFMFTEELRRCPLPLELRLLRLLVLRIDCDEEGAVIGSIACNGVDGIGSEGGG